MRIGLTTEGTYPFAKGGVSTWVHQVVTGLPELEFTVTALTGGAVGDVQYDLPANVTRVDRLNIWGRPPRARLTRRITMSEFAEAWEAILQAGLTPGLIAPLDALAAWTRLTEPDTSSRIHTLVTSRQAVDLLARTYRRARGEAISVRDATLSAYFIARALGSVAAPDIDADVIHATANGPSVLPALSGLRRGIPFVLSEHGVYFRERLLAHRSTEWPSAQLHVVTAVFRAMVEVGYTAATMIAPCANFNTRWETRLGASPDRIRTLHNGVDLKAFPQAMTQLDEPALSFVGRVDPLKDLVTMVQAVALVAESFPEVKLRIFGPVPAGNEWYFEVVRAECQRLNIVDRVIFEGSIAEPWRGYHAGNVSVLSSITEGFPYSALEALACGRPMVATDVGGVREVLGDIGLVVPAKQPKLLADALVALLKDPAERARLGRLGRARVESRFALDLMLDRVRNIYSDVTRQVIDEAREPDRLSA